ncbi:hypothetical protein IJ843_03425 [bacterium]|nr:hypothetical protein [bacterium]
MIKKYLVAFLMFFIGMVVFSKAWAYTIANKNAYVDTYVQPCFKNPEGYKYCSGQA